MSLRRFSLSAITSPPQVSKLVSWLDVSKASTVNAGSPTNNDAVSSLTDRASGLNYVQATSAKQPIYKTDILYGKPGLLCDPASNQYLEESTATLLEGNKNFKIFELVYLTQFDQPYKYFSNFKGAAAGNSPSLAFSTNAGYKDFFFGADSAITQWVVNRWTTVNNLTTQAHLVRVDYNGASQTTFTNFTGYGDGTLLTRTSTSGNDGSTTNMWGAYKASSIYNFKGYLFERLVYKDLSSWTASDDYQITQYFRGKWNVAA